MPAATLDPREVILSAVEGIAESCGVIRASSDCFATPAFPPGSGPDYVNAAVVLECDLSPVLLLDQLHAIEAQHGRLRRARWAARSLDLDLLAYDRQILPDLSVYESWQGMSLNEQRASAPDRLVLPHPRLQERAFVLVPLLQALERAGLDWVHPVTGGRVPQMLSALPAADIGAIKPL